MKRNIQPDNAPKKWLDRKTKTRANKLTVPKIPSCPIAYWADENLINCFNNTKLESIGNIKVGLQTGENDRFLRYWFEVDFNKIGFSSKTCEDSSTSGYKWFPYNKGGSFRKWYGNQEYIINWENDGDELRNFKKSVLRNSKFYFYKSLSWSKISSGKIAFRYYPNGFIFDVAGCSVFLNENLNYIMGFLNSNVCSSVLDLISPTLNYEVGHISSLPIKIDETKKDKIEKLVLNNISICEEDWNDYETSWNFKKHPLLYFNNNLLESNYNEWVEYKNNQFNNLKQNEIKLNELFSKTYNLPFDNTIEDKHISIKKPNLNEDIKSFISFAVGCMFGRYNLDVENLFFAGGIFDLTKYNKFIPDNDNIIPILDTEYFEDDIVGKFVEFVKICYGKEYLEENLEFISNSLSTTNKSSRDKLRDYFIKDFFNNHNKIYKKRPIYWQFNSGKENAFNCLIYVHRFDSTLIAKIRTEYLHKTQKAIEQRISNCNEIFKNTDSNSEKVRVIKEKNKLIKQLEESVEFDEVLNHIINLNICIDLDDGIKINHNKFQNIVLHKDGVKDKKINLLKKI
ncbi:BREX-1 system adenine-specific DNA-methyltransferase PglX [Methanobrevibacter oralis]|uniref:BREX-1 system adenine-specific DNA-methyltransferase PglX n=1 Tax=Methanobrevibacter oralis TaxID=66851 RepID=UPI000D0F4A4B